MVSFVPKFLFTATVTAPAFLPLGLIGITKDSKNYFQHWNNLLENGVILTFSLSYLFQKNCYKCDIAPSLPTSLYGVRTCSVRFCTKPSTHWSFQCYIFPCKATLQGTPPLFTLLCVY